RIKLFNTIVRIKIIYKSISSYKIYIPSIINVNPLIKKQPSNLNTSFIIVPIFKCSANSSNFSIISSSLIEKFTYLTLIFFLFLLLFQYLHNNLAVIPVLFHHLLYDKEH